MTGDQLPEREARTLAALIRVYARDGRATVRSVAEEAGRAPQIIHADLTSLDARGFVSGLGGKGTLAPTIWPVLFGADR